MIVNVTLDTNCLIDLKEERPYAPYIPKLITADSAGTISPRIVGISASERPKVGELPIENFSQFEERVRQIGVDQAAVLKPKGYWDMSFYDSAVYGNGGDDDSERAIHEVLFPTVAFEYADHCAAKGIDPDGPIDGTWLNAKCDVLALWSHIAYGGDIFVTGDRNFRRQKKRPRLIELGARDILTPKQAIERLRLT